MRISRRFGKSGAWIGALVVSSLAAIPFGCTETPLGKLDDGAKRPLREVSAGGAAGAAPETIVVGSFNMARFGPSKGGKPEVMEQFAQIVAQFDVVALQEVQLASDEEPLRRLLVRANEISREGGYASDYAYLISGKISRVGTGSYYEQYVFVYDQSLLEIDPSTIYQVADPSDRLHREPYVARFRCRRRDQRQGFSFSLVNVHTDPDELPEELPALGDVYRAIAADGSGEDDVILLGDFNADAAELTRLGGVAELRPTILDGEMTNVRRTAQYDNFVCSSLATREFAGAAGVLEFDAEGGLTREQALDVSDHLPVWATFSTLETPPALASGPARRATQ